jgi:putative PIN family toxin of toxin-antitoxin system
MWLVTPEILSEYVDVLRRPKFNLTDEVLSRWSALLQMRTVQVPSPQSGHVVNFPRDPKDAPFLAAAIAHDTDWLVTGDRDLFAAQSLVSARVASVGQFAAEFQIVE